ncbi:MAG: hypothetical protein COB84_06845 [Rhodobacteraceae bacterium]|nr:MAG: hypothetical protein COB84_06845 [Paracoccaceae bacterium]
MGQGSQTEFVKEQVAELRMKLLDLTNRNALLNFRHSEKALTHIRIIDELPDFLFGEFIDGKKLKFKPLPEPDNEPHDEKTEEFEIEVREAMLTDEEYLEDIKNLEDQDDSFDDIAVIERDLKNRVRERLGLPTLTDLKPLSNAQWAKQHDLVPKYDMPTAPEDRELQSNKFYDDYIQTLLKPKELQHKLSGLKRYITTDINETGVNTFYAAFGFLERYDSNNSDRPFLAPLMLLQLDEPANGRTRDGGLEVSIQASGEDPQYNLPLAEKLQEFGLRLPALDEDDTPESYMQKVERLIEKQKGWRVRRFITIGRFQFARLVMYHDLDPDRWPENNGIDNNEIITSLIAGAKEGSGSAVTDDPDIYDIDTDPKVTEAAPILIMEADSSQHSAIVDAMQGKNLVIKGPPGTGKSQTITNLIANAINKGKTVLFIAEKMAALNVVHKRIQSVGLGDYCLELHSTKAKLKDIKSGLATTIENRKSATRPHNLKKQIDEIKEAQSYLRNYSDTLNQTFGGADKTIYDILWGEQNRRSIVENLPVSIKRIRIENALSYSEQQLQSLCSELERLTSYELENNKYTKDKHPWVGVEIVQASALKAGEIIQAFEESANTLSLLLAEIKIFDQEFQWTAKKTIAEWRTAYSDCQKILSLKDTVVDFGLLKLLKSPDSLASASSLINYFGKYDQLIFDIKLSLADPVFCIEHADDISKRCTKAKSLNLEDQNTEDLTQHIEEQKHQIRQWEKAYRSFGKISQKIFGIPDTELNMNNLTLLLKAFGFLSDIERDHLFLRHEEAISETNRLVITNAASQQQNLNDQTHELEQRFDLNYDITKSDLNEAVYELSTANALSFFKPKYYLARKTYKTVSISPDKISASAMANHLRALKSYKEDKTTFEQDVRYQQVAGVIFDGMNTDFSGLAAINDWAIRVRKEFNGLDEYKDKIKRFLLHADVSDIEAVKEEIDDIDAKALLDGICSDNEQRLADFITGMKSSLQSTEHLYEFLLEQQVSPVLTYSKLAGLINDPIKKASNIRSYIKDNTFSLQSKLGDFFDELNTNRDELRKTVELSGYVEALNLPDGLDSCMYNLKLFPFIGKLSALLQKLASKLDKAESSMLMAQEVSDLNIKDYMGTDTIQDASIESMAQSIDTSLNNKEALNSHISLRDFLETAKLQPYANLLDILKMEGLDYQKAAGIFEYLYYRTLCDKALNDNKKLDNQASFSLTEVRERFVRLDGEIIDLNCRELAYNLAQSQLPEGISRGRVSEYTDMGLIRHQALKEKTRAISIRKLLTRAGGALQALKPCFLMSPLSVAQYIAPQGIKFDMLVIDEASQMRPEDALGAIARSGQIVVVGDPKQLPPTTFFSKQTVRDEDYDDEDKIDNESILDLALGRFRPTRDLRWHYRSRHESLIAYSNAHFYDNRLIVFPSPEDRSENFGVHYNYVGGTYNASCNIDETKAIVAAAKKFMRDHPDKSLGIATMNSKQRDLIYEEMSMLFLHDDVAEAYRQKWDTEDGGLEPFFVKNLESVQGDERDAIFISTVYGPDKNGVVMQRFGPINGKFGHRRLNVLFTRAKYNTVLFTSLRPDDIKVTETSSLGLKAFKGYLTYASVGTLDTGEITGKEPDSDFEISVMEKLESIGCEVIPQVGVAGFFIDLGVKHPDYPYGFMMGIECDGAAYHSSKSARDRDRTRQEVLEGLGWEIYRIWSTDWFHNPDKEFDKLKLHIELTIKRKAGEWEERERARLSNVVNLQQKVQEDLFTAREQAQKNAQYTTRSEKQTQPQVSNDNVVELFDTVSFQYIDEQEKSVRTVTIVSSQSDVSTGNINQHSAMGRALVGSELAEEVEISLPNGSKALLITDIKKPSLDNQLCWYIV